MLFGVLLLAASLGLVFRSFLVILGKYKGPVLETYERYGNEEPFFYPWPWLFVWLGCSMISLGLIISYSVNVVTVLGFMLLFTSWVLYTVQERVQTLWENTGMPLVPLWLNRLSKITTRYERRRIAYMWLHLPKRTRLLYNASDRFFFNWAELVIMATVREG